MNTKTGKYVLFVEYETGDSFGHEHTHEVVDYCWDNYDVVCDNAHAIAEHSRLYSDAEFGYLNKETIRNKCKGHWWYVEPKPVLSGATPEAIDESIYLKLDDGRTVLYRCPWCGYFETFYSVEVQYNKLLKITADDCR